VKRVIVFVRNAAFDEVSSHFVTLRSYAHGFASAGFACEFRELDTWALGNELDRDLARKEVAAFFCMNGFGMKADAGGNGKLGDKFAASGKPLLCHIGNQPFYSYMIDFVLADHPFKVSFYKDASMHALVWRLLRNPVGAHCVIPTIMHRFEEKPALAKVPPGRRAIPFVYVGTYHDPEFIRGRFVAAFPDWVKAFEQLVDAALFEHAVPIWSIAERIAVARGEYIDWRDRNTLALLDAADGFVRWRRRELLLRRLVRHRGLFIGGGTSSLELHPQALCRRSMPQMKTLKVFYAARCCVMAQPNHPFSHSERMLSAMSRGCIAATDVNNAIRAEFTEGLHYLGLDDDYANLDEQLERLNDDALTQDIARAAREAVGRAHDPDVVVAGMLNACAAFGLAIHPDG
jgi:Glycosyl transferases group 1